MKTASPPATPNEPKTAGPRVRAVPAVTRALAILRLLGRHRTPLGVKAIARELELVPSTALHILRALVAEQLVRVDPGTKQYSLGVGMLALARTVLENSSFANLIQHELDRISKAHGVTAFGTELMGLEHMVVVALSRASIPMRLHVDIGSRFPALISATGRCVAAFGEYSPEELRKRFRALIWQNAPSWEAWWKDVGAARRQGYAVDRGNYIDGVTIVAAPVLGPRQAMAYGIAAAGLASQLNRAAAVALGQDLQAAAATVASQLPA